MNSRDKTLEMAEKRLDEHEFIILKASNIGYLEEDGSFIKLAILKEDIDEAIYANHIAIELGEEDD